MPVAQPLGRIAPPDDAHVRKYPLRALLGTADAPKHVPVAIGVNWYSSFYEPTFRNRNWWLPDSSSASLGAVRGGHCVCLEPYPDHDLNPAGAQDPASWWYYYDQGEEGSCVGHGVARVQSLLNRKRYDAVWLYREAQKIDGLPLPHQGTFVHSACEVMRAQGLKPARGETTTALSWSSATPIAGEGITAYRWATSVEDIATVLGLPPSREYFTVLNSWGRYGYPHRTKLPFATLQRLLDESGEAMVVTDR